MAHAAAILFATSMAMAPTAAPSTPLVLSLGDVIAMARDGAPDAQTAQAQIAVSAAAVDRAAAAAMPALGLSSSVSPGVQVTMPLLSQDQNALCSAGNLACSVGAAPVGSARTGASIDLRWRHFDFGAIAASVDEREAALSATQARSVAATSRAIAVALKTYIQILADDELVEVRRGLMRDRQRQAEVVRARATLGEGSPSPMTITKPTRRMGDPATTKPTAPGTKQRAELMIKRSWPMRIGRGGPRSKRVRQAYSTKATPPRAPSAGATRHMVSVRSAGKRVVSLVPTTTAHRATNTRTTAYQT